MSPLLFNSTSHGSCTLAKLRTHVKAYLRAEPDRTYRMVIGTDSLLKKGIGTDFVIALIIHRVGAGGIYFWRRIVDKKEYFLRDRMYQEAMYSLQTASEFMELFKSDRLNCDMEIHVDIGSKGETRELIAEIVGMVRASGFTVKTKPDSFGASKVADRHT